MEATNVGYFRALRDVTYRKEPDFNELLPESPATIVKEGAVVTGELVSPLLTAGDVFIKLMVVTPPEEGSRRVYCFLPMHDLGKPDVEFFEECARPDPEVVVERTFQHVEHCATSSTTAMKGAVDKEARARERAEARRIRAAGGKIAPGAMAHITLSPELEAATLKSLNARLLESRPMNPSEMAMHEGIQKTLSSIAASEYAFKDARRLAHAVKVVEWIGNRHGAVLDPARWAGGRSCGDAHTPRQRNER